MDYYYLIQNHLFCNKDDINSIKMPKVRVWHEDMLIAHVITPDNITEKYHFDFNHKLVANNSDIKGIAVRKNKVNIINLTGEVGFGIDDVNNTQQYTGIH
jgi:hypothetical protein